MPYFFVKAKISLETTSVRCSNTAMKDFQAAAPAVWSLLSLPEREALAALSEGPVAFQHSQIFVVMKATRLCNLRCTYCNYWREGPNQVMSLEMLEKATRDALSLPWVERVDFVWHGGETTLLPMSFFEKAMELQTRYKGNRVVTNSIQTNATKLDDAWIEFFKKNEFSVGVSIDPPPERHAKYRITKSGADSWKETLAGLRRLEKSGINHGCLVVVNADLMSYGAEKFLACLDEHGITKVALLNVIPENSAPKAGTANYLDWDRFVDFMIELYRLWDGKYRDRLKLREIQSLEGNVRKQKPTSCVFAGNCMGQFLTVEPSGQVSACDKYVDEKQYIFGDISKEPLSAILSGERLAKVQSEYFQQQDALEKCKYYDYCNGGCPHDQHLRSKLSGGETINCCGLSRLIDVMRSGEKNEQGLAKR